jgi:hypothetical protein
MTNTTNIQEHTGEIVDQILEGELPENIRSEGVQSATKAFDNLETDVKLAVLYYLYEAMGESVTPAAPGAASAELSQSFFDEFNALPFGDAQLDAMRSLLRSDDNSLCRHYGILSENNKLVIWYVLAERMGKDVVGIPQDYALSEAGNSSLESVKQLDFEQQITFLRDVASAMGKETLQRAT